MTKKVSGINFGGNSLPGAQTIGRKLAQQFNLRGGLANAVDISAQNPNEWLNCTNAQLPSISPNAFGGIRNFSYVNMGSNFLKNSQTTYGDSAFSFTTQPFDTCVATLEIGVSFPSESVIYTGTGTGSTITSISAGDKCEQLALTASQTITGTYTVPAKNLTGSYVYSPNTVIGFDTNWTGNGNFSSGFIRIGSDSSNYYQWSITSPGADGNKILKFDWTTPTSTVGTPNLNSMSYVVINFIANAGGALTVKVSNLRIGAFSSTSLSNNNYTQYASNISNAFPYVSNSNTSVRQVVMQCCNNLYIQQQSNTLGSNDSNQSFIPLKSGFTNLISTANVFQQQFYFTTFPKSGTASENLLYWVNGNDGIFSYDANASAGSRFTQISATAMKYITSHKNYMWYAGDPANPNTITPSIIATPGTLDTANAITLNNQDGQNIITGMISMDDYLIIFRTKDVWIMLGTTTGTGGDIVIRKSNSTVGAIHQKAITRNGAVCYFCNNSGFYYFDGNNSTLISEKINFSVNPSGGAINSAGVGLFFNPNDQCIYITALTSDPNQIGNTLNPIASGNYSQQGMFVFNSILKCFYYLGGTASSNSVFCGAFNFCSPVDNKNYFYIYGLNFFTPAQAGNLILPYDQSFLVQSSWNNLGSPFVQKDPDKIRLFITTDQASPAVTGTLNFRTDYTSAIAYTTTFTVPVSGTGSGFVDLTIGPGAQGHAFSVEVDVPNSNGTAPSGNLVYSGYGISWTEAEVI